MDAKHKTITQNEAIVVGFEAPGSPDASYNNVYPVDPQEEKNGPPVIPHYLHDTVLNFPAGRDHSEPLPVPHNGILNHLYREKTEAEGPVMAVGLTHRFRGKYVTVVLYKPVHGNGSTST